MNDQPVQAAVILFAHGARDPQWALPFQRLVAELGELLPGERIVLAFLELMQPSLQECAASLHGEGVRSLRVVLYCCLPDSRSLAWFSVMPVTAKNSRPNSATAELIQCHSCMRLSQTARWRFAAGGFTAGKFT